MVMEESMTSNDQGPKTPAGYFKNGRAWLVEAEDNLVEGQDSATLAMLAIASALLALCAQFIKEQGDD
jgi:hypothetical protein